VTYDVGNAGVDGAGNAFFAEIGKELSMLEAQGRASSKRRMMAGTVTWRLYWREWSLSRQSPKRSATMG